MQRNKYIGIKSVRIPIKSVLDINNSTNLVMSIDLALIGFLSSFDQLWVIYL